MHKRHHNQVRIIGGTHRGRKIDFPTAEGLRPTADSVRERLFNWLGQDLTGLRVLDLFAGSGVMGMEAASRHAMSVVMVEANRIVAKALQDNVNKLNFQKINVICGEALLHLNASAQIFDVVFLDPPYAWAEWPILFDRIGPHLEKLARVYVEAERLPELPPSWMILKEGKSGMSRFVLCQVA
nr:16S rRNA (guanine(966)-N(2))-methyltransferase RsmD [Snodgrassella sp. CFCC 13594]